MGAGDNVALGRAVAIVALALGATACDLEQCPDLDLRATDLRADEAPPPERAVVAISDRGTIEIVRACADASDCDAATPVPGDLRPEQLMLTGSGRWLVFRTQSDLRRVDLNEVAATDEPARPEGYGTASVDELIGSLRGGDWIVYRSRNGDTTSSVAAGQLHAVYVGDEQFDGDDEFALGPGLDLRVVALGHRHVVARRGLGEGTEELYLIRVAPARRVDELGSHAIGKAQLLVRGDSFQRVIITEGPSPAERGDPDEFQHEVPTDVQVIATSGEGPTARTLIYSVADLSQIANFAGEVVTKHAPLEDVPGLSPVSPSGTHLAYITPSGALALRDLEDQSSCMVRSSSGATHLLAGFARDATLYFESEEDRLETDGANQLVETAEIVYTYDPLAREFSSLTATAPDSVSRIKAVPAHHEPGEPWAIVSSGGAKLARAGHKPRTLGYDEASYLPRDDGLWVVEAEPETYDRDGRLNVHRLDTESSEVLFEHEYQPLARVCVSTSQTATQHSPWATQCSPSSDPERFLDNGLPEPEQL